MQASMVNNVIDAARRRGDEFVATYIKPNGDNEPLCFVESYRAHYEMLMAYNVWEDEGYARLRVFDVEDPYDYLDDGE